MQTVKILKNIIKFLQRVQTMKTNLDHPPAGEPVSADEGEVRPRRQVVPRECHQKYDVPGNYFNVSSNWTKCLKNQPCYVIKMRR